MKLKTHKPKVTVITGYYNRADALEKTIDSIMNQTFKDFEFIVFNDKSTDNTESKLKEIEKKYNDPKLIIINHQQNKGFVQGMIDSIKISNGEYICVQGSGDISNIKRLEKQVSLLDSNKNIGVVGCFYENYIEDNGISRLRKKNAENITFKKLVGENIFSHGEVMFKKNVYFNVGGYRKEFVNCQDYDLWLRMIKITNFSTVKENLYTRYVRYDGVSYKPEKFLKQLKYKTLCLYLAKISEELQVKKLKEIDEKGIDKVISLNSSKLQFEIIKASLRSTIWGNELAAEKLIKLGITSKLLRLLIIMILKLYSLKIFTPLRKILNQYFNIKHK